MVVHVFMDKMLCNSGKSQDRGIDEFKKEFRGLLKSIGWLGNDSLALLGVVEDRFNLLEVD
jgi:hypothetical protein